MAGENLVYCGAKVFAGDGNAAAGAAGVILTAIDQAEIGIEEEEVRRARCFVFVSDILRLVVEIGELEAERLGLPLEAFGAV